MMPFLRPLRDCLVLVIRRVSRRGGDWILCFISFFLLRLPSSFVLILLPLHVLMFLHVATHFLEGLLYDTGTGAD